MSINAKGLVAVVITLIGLFSAVFIEEFVSNAYRSHLIIKVIIPLLVSVAGLYLGVRVRREGGKIWGLIAIVFGIIAAANYILRLFGFGN